MGKDIRFVCSSLGLVDTKKSYISLDNYIKINNPTFNIQVDKNLRNSRVDWIKCGSFVAEKHNKYFEIFSDRLNALHNQNNDEKFWRQVFYTLSMLVGIILFVIYGGFDS